MKKFLLLIILIFIGTASIPAQNVDFEKLDAYFEKAAIDWGIPGMSVGIVKDGKIVFSKGYGVLELGKTEMPDGNTLYAIASNSKAFTSAIIAMLVQEGKLNWDDKVQNSLYHSFLYKKQTSSLKIV